MQKQVFGEINPMEIFQDKKKMIKEVKMVQKKYTFIANLFL